jgi:hypothetical protein
MQTNCRPGDIALVLGDCSNDGLIVTVCRPDDSDWKHDWEGVTWWVRSSAALAWGFVENNEDYVAFEGPLPDSILRPIRGSDVVGGGLTRAKESTPAELEGET